jgi:hypothetical protein
MPGTRRAFAFNHAESFAVRAGPFVFNRGVGEPDCHKSGLIPIPLKTLSPKVPRG